MEQKPITFKTDKNGFLVKSKNYKNYIIPVIITVLMSIVFVIASGILTDNYIQVPTANFSQLVYLFGGANLNGSSLNNVGQINSINLTVDRFNEGLWVKAGNESDVQPTIDLCPNDGNICTVHIPRGDYECTQSVTASYSCLANLTSNIHIKCEEGAKFISTNGSTIFGLEHQQDLSYSYQNISVSGCEFDGDGTHYQSGIAYNLISLRSNVDNVQIYENKFFDTYEFPVVVVGLNETYAGSNVQIYDNYGENIESGFTVVGGHDVQISGNRLTARPCDDGLGHVCGGGEWGEAVDVDRGINGVVSNNIFIGFNENCIDANLNSLVVTDNICVGSGDTIVRADHIKTAGFDNIIISNNVIKNISGDDRGIYVEGNNTLIFGNIIEGNGTGMGISFTGVTGDNIYFGNIISNVSTEVVLSGTNNYFDIGANVFLKDNLQIRFNGSTRYIQLSGNSILYNSGYTGGGTTSGHIFDVDDAGGGATGQNLFRCSGDNIFEVTCTNDGDSSTFTFSDDNGDKLKVDSSGNVNISRGKLIMKSGQAICMDGDSCAFNLTYNGTCILSSGSGNCI